MPKLVAEALKYYDLPIHLKVLHSIQNQSVPRGSPKAVVFQSEGNHLYYLLENQWKKESCPTVPELEHSTPALVVNNFIVVCNQAYDAQTWHIFDIQMQSWSEIANPSPENVKAGFALVYHDKKLYAIGGHIISDEKKKKICKSITTYCFETDSWTTLPTEHPEGVVFPAACVHSNYIYTMCGKRWKEEDSVPEVVDSGRACLLYTSPSPRDKRQSRMPSSA